MKSCEKCQKEFTDDVNFCNQCGTKLVATTHTTVDETVQPPAQPVEQAPVTPIETPQTEAVPPQPEPVQAQGTAPHSDKSAEDVADEFYQKSKETIKNVGNKVNGFIEKPDSEFDANSGTYGQLRNENYGLYYVKIFRIIIIIVAILVFLFSAFAAFQIGYYNPIGALFGLFGAVISAGLTYFFLNFSLKMFENLARIGRNILDIRNMMMEEKNKNK